MMIEFSVQHPVPSIIHSGLCCWASGHQWQLAVNRPTSHWWIMAVPMLEQSLQHCYIVNCLYYNRYISAGEQGTGYDKEKISSEAFSSNWLQPMLTRCTGVAGRCHAGNVLSPCTHSGRV